MISNAPNSSTALPRKISYPEQINDPENMFLLMYYGPLIQAWPTQIYPGTTTLYRILGISRITQPEFKNDNGMFPRKLESHNPLTIPL